MISMSKGERDDLWRLIQQRERVLKSAAKQRSAELLADFENQIASEYAFDDDAVWQEAAKAADQSITKAKLQIAARCRELRIPEGFAPTLELVWHHRGHDNMVEQRKVELRKLATSRIEAMGRKAIIEVEMQSLNGQTQIAASGLTSAAARSFIAQLPAVKELMPRLAYSEVSGETEPPIFEQLVSPNALRQRRFCERQAALRNAYQALQSPLRNAQVDGERPAGMLMEKALRERIMSRAKFTQSDVHCISKAAAKSGVPVVAEFIAPDGNKIIITAGRSGMDDEGDGTDLNKVA